MRRFSFALCVMLFAGLSAQAQHKHHQIQSKAQPQIVGEYVESRNADVYTGFCVANGEVNLVGNTAILGWRVQQGAWDGVDLSGLSIVAAVNAASTLGSTYGDPFPVKSVLIVDEKASAEQRAALAAFAKAMGGKMLDNVVRIEVAPVSLDIEYQGEHPASADLKAGGLASIRTRSLTSKDHLCGNEETFYPPLTATTHAMPAVAVTDEFQGSGLNTVWSLHGKRSAFVGNFAR